MNAIEQVNVQYVSEKTGLTGGQLANAQAANAAFSIYRTQKSKNTQLAQSRALKRFGHFLTAHYGEQFRQHATEKGKVHSLYSEPSAWAPVTWGYVVAYRQRLLADGEAIATINQHLSAIRVYAAMAFQADFLSSHEERKISKVSGVQGSKAKANVNAKRENKDARKSVNTLDKKTVRKLGKRLSQNCTPVGLRDQLLFEVMFRHGLRASEVLLLTKDSFTDTHLVFERPKVAHVGADAARHEIEQSTIDAFNAYAALIGDDEPFLQSAKRGNRLSGKQLGRSSLHRAVEKWGDKIGVAKLSAHDARHSIATILANMLQGTKEARSFKLLTFFGWSSITTAQRYVERASIGNQGMKKAF